MATAGVASAFVGNRKPSLSLSPSSPMNDPVIVNTEGRELDTFAASYLNTQGLNNSCLKSPASTLVDLTFQ